MRADPQCRKAASPLLSWNAKAVWSEAMTGTLRRRGPGAPNTRGFRVVGWKIRIAEPPASRQDTALLDEAATAVWSVATY